MLNLFPISATEFCLVHRKKTLGKGREAATSKRNRRVHKVSHDHINFNKPAWKEVLLLSVIVPRCLKKITIFYSLLFLVCEGNAE